MHYGELKCLLASVLIHAVTLYALAPSIKFTPPPPPAKQDNIMRVQILPPESLVKKTGVPKPGKSASAIDEKICAGKDSAYVGVGIIIQPGTDRITSAPVQYPAYRAGLREGDLLINPFSTNISADGYLDLTVERNNVSTKYHIKAEKICYQRVEHEEVAMGRTTPS